MNASKNCLAVIKHYEGFYPNPYLCPAHVATIGYGTTLYENGKPVSLKDKKITEAEATELLIDTLQKFENKVNALLKVKVEQHQFDALVSFAYNLGNTALQDSTLLRLINNGELQKPNWQKAITKEFQKWCKARVKGKTVTLKGLLSRRTTEALLFTNNIVTFFN